MKGNIAIAEAAVRAGVRLYAGYPITPSSEIMEYLSWRLPEVGGAFVQAESELAGINMVYGGSSCGVRVLTASSGPGISLKQEGISVLSDEELPALVINVVRYGNGLGTLFSSQCDYLRETRGGGNGDYRCIVLCPSSIQEAVDMVSTAYELGEKYRVVVVMMPFTFLLMCSKAFSGKGHAVMGLIKPTLWPSARSSRMAPSVLLPGTP